jgi:hypothetical protein
VEKLYTAIQRIDTLADVRELTALTALPQKGVRPTLAARA